MHPPLFQQDTKDTVINSKEPRNHLYNEQKNRFWTIGFFKLIKNQTLEASDIHVLRRKTSRTRI
jgi:hypothetical protein